MAPHIEDCSSGPRRNRQRPSWFTAPAVASAAQPCNWRARAGMTVIGTAGSEAGLKLVKKEGAHHVLNHSSDGYLDELMKLTEGRGVDVIVELLANKNLAKDLTVLAKKGRVAVIGSRGTIEINPRDAMGREADIRGVTLMNTSEPEYKTMHAALVAGLENGTLRPVIGRENSAGRGRARPCRDHEAVRRPWKDRAGAVSLGQSGDAGSSTAVAASDSNELPTHSPTRRRWIWIVLLWAVVYIPGLFSPPLLDDADSIHAEAARELLVRHDWTTLYIDGVRYLEKAPLMYWAMAASYKVFGVRDWAARVPLVLGVLALLLATYSLGKRTLGERAGFWAAVVLAVSVGPYIFTRFLIPDLLVTLWLTLGLDFFLRTLDQEPPSRLSCWGLAATMALNVLTKGLIGLVFPAAIIGLYLLLTGNLKHLLRLRLLSSFVVFLAIAAPWHIAAALAESTCRTIARIPVVLLHQRAVSALPGQARSARLRHRSSARFLGADAGVAVSLVGVCVAVAGAGAASLEPVAQWDEPATTRASALRHLGGGHSGVLQLLHAPGVLRHSRAARTGLADWRLAATGGRIARNFQVAAQWANRVGRTGRARDGGLRGRDVPAGAEQEHARRQRSRRPA